METITTNCPGCCIACGLYLLEFSTPELPEGMHKLSLAHRKLAPMNEGKLCKFGMHLPTLYGRTPLPTLVDGAEAPQDAAIREAKSQLARLKPDEIAFVALPSAVTNEEIVSFASGAKACGSPNLCFGFEQFLNALSEDARSALISGFPFYEIEVATKIVLFLLDPYVHYPLLARRILKAREQGAQVIDIAFAQNWRGIADETVLIDPLDPESLQELRDTVANSLIIGEMTPYTSPGLISRLLGLAAETASQLFLLKPFTNSTGALLLGSSEGAAAQRKDLFTILDCIEAGSIKGLYLLETDLSAVLSYTTALKQTLSQLDVLIEQNAFRTPQSEFAHVTLQSEPFYRKRGTILNIEGRLLTLGGESTNGLSILEQLGNNRTFAEVHAEVKTVLGFETKEPTEFEIAAPRIATSIDAATLPQVECEKRAAVDDEHYVLWYKTNPFFWTGIRDKGFVEISPAAMQALGLFIGDMIIVDEAEDKMGFTVTEVPEKLIVSEDPLQMHLQMPWHEIQKAGTVRKVLVKRT
ncbi:MAG: molybdopterin-dependent oxidoreductase [Candidatus Methanospirareceae archaeon]